MTTLMNNKNIDLEDKDVLHQFIQSRNVGDVLQKVKPTHRELVDLPSSSTIEQAFDLLLAHDILSIPIYRTDKNGQREYITIVSALDLLKLLSTKVSLDTLQKNRDVLLMPLSDAVGMTETMSVLKSSDGLDKLLQLFSYEKTHRVLIEQANATFVLLSQMDLIRFFQSCNHQLGSSILDLSVHDIKSTGIRATLNYKCTAAEAFLKLAGDNTISALPILDDNEDLIGEISAKDLRGLNRDRWETLSKPVVMYLKTSHGELFPPLTCHDGFTLSQIMTAFVIRKTYRLWWMDLKTGELKGVISLTDILSTFASHI